MTQGWYSASWSKRIKLTIDSTKVSSNLTDFPVYVNLANLDADLFTTARSDGGDIRITKADGVTELPRELVTFTPGSSTGELHFKANLYDVTDSQFYLYYGNAAATEPAVSATYGRNNVWTNGYANVYHLNQDPSGSAPQMIDSTSNGRDGTSSGSMTSGDLVAVKVGNGLDLDGSNDTVTVSGFGMSSNSNVTVEAWIKPAAIGSDMPIVDESGTPAYGGGLHFRVRSTGKLRFWTQDATNNLLDSAATLSAATLYHVAGTYDGSNNKIYINGSQDATVGTVAPSARNASSPRIGASTSSPGVGGNFNGLLDEIRISTSARSAAWITTSYNNQNDPSTFYTDASPESYSAYSSTWYDADWDYRVKVTAQNAKVYADLTDFPLYLDLSLLPAGFFTHVDSTGKDIRVTRTDSVTELPIDLVALSTGSSTGELHFRDFGTLANSTDTDYYVYYGYASATAPAVTSEFGRNNVWRDYVAVYHLQEAVNNTAGGYIDSTGKSNDGTGTSMSITAPAGKLAGNAAEFDGSADYITITPIVADIAAATTGEVSCWANTDTNSVTQELWNFDNSSGYGAAGQINSSGGMRAFVGDGSGSATDTDIVAAGSVTASTWQNWAFVQDGTNEKIYLNGTALSTTGTNSTEWFDGVTLDRAYIGIAFNTTLFPFNGKIDEFRVCNTPHASTWRSTEYDNQSANNTFFSIGAETSSGPTLQTLSPADNATGVAVNANLVLTFDVTVTKGTGNITIKKTSDNSTVETIDVTNAIVSVSTTTVTINPVNQLLPSTGYYVQIPSGAITSWAGITDTTSWSFTTGTDAINPTVVSLSPVDGATDVSLQPALAITFDEPISVGTGNITIKKVSDNSTVQTIAVTDPSVSVAGNVATIQIGTDLPGATALYIQAASGTFVDASANAWAGISTTTDWNITTRDVTGPTLTATSPTTGATGVSTTANLTMTFDENVYKNIGQLRIRRNDDLLIGRSQSGTNISQTVHLGDVIVTSDNLAQAERDKVLGYLSWKWKGDGSLLPADHPYKNVRPYLD